MYIFLDYISNRWITNTNKTGHSSCFDPVDQTDMVKISIRCRFWGESQYSPWASVADSPQCLTLTVPNREGNNIGTHFDVHTVSNRTLATTISKHKNSNFWVAGERCASENNCTPWVATAGAFTGIQLWLLLPEPCCSEEGGKCVSDFQ